MPAGSDFTQLHDTASVHSRNLRLSLTGAHIVIAARLLGCEIAAIVASFCATLSLLIAFAAIHATHVVQHFSKQQFTYHDCNSSLSYMHFSSFQCIARPHTSLHDYILCHSFSMIQACYQALRSTLGNVSEIGSIQDNQTSSTCQGSYALAHLSDLKARQWIQDLAVAAPPFQVHPSSSMDL